MVMLSVCVPLRAGTPLAVDCLWSVLAFREEQLWVDSGQSQSLTIPLICFN